MLVQLCVKRRVKLVDVIITGNEASSMSPVWFNKPPVVDVCGGTEPKEKIALVNDHSRRQQMIIITVVVFLDSATIVIPYFLEFSLL